MIRRVLTLAALLLAAPLHAQSADDTARLAEFKAFATAFRKERAVLSLSYAIVKDGRIVAAEGVGWQDHDAEERTTGDTSYLVASITKTFTGATLLQMDADKVIRLDDEFTTLSDWKGRCERLTNSGNMFGGGVKLEDGYVPPKLDCTAKISVRQVLQMRVLGKPTGSRRRPASRWSIGCGSMCSTRQG
jgi:CubicO group peptidase (beta-lactamase class C family)